MTRRLTLLLGIGFLLAAFCLVIVEGAILPRCPELSACVRLYEAVAGRMPDHGIGG